MSDHDEYSQSLDDRQQQLEMRVHQLIESLLQDFHDLGDRIAPSVVRALLHQAVHFAASRGDRIRDHRATQLAEMITHAHDLMHEQRGEPEPGKRPHEKLVH